MKNRIEYIDCLRGTTMIFVVFSHVAFTIFFWGKPGICPVNDIVNLLIMPLFFFIMGIFAYLPVKDGWQSTLKRRIKNRLLCQLFPTVIISLIYISVYSISINEYLFNSTKVGYWFTWVAFLYFVFYAILSHLFYRFGQKKCWLALILLLIALLSFPINFLCSNKGLWNSGSFNLFSTQYFLTNLIYFLLGIIAKIYWENLIKLIRRKFTVILLLAIFVLPYTTPYKELLHLHYLQSVSGMLLCFSIFNRLNGFFSSKTMIGRLLSFVGQYTLEIYLFHWFVLNSLRQTSIVYLAPYIESSVFVQTIVTLSVSIAIVAFVVLFCVALRKFCKPVYRILFGKVNTATFSFNNQSLDPQ